MTGLNGLVAAFRRTFTHYGGPAGVSDKVPNVLTVREYIPSAKTPVRDMFFRRTAGPPIKIVPRDRTQAVGGSAAVGAKFTMVPSVQVKPGDIVARGNGEAVETIARGSFGVMVERFLKTGKWEMHKGFIGHVGVVARGPNGKLGVYEVFTEAVDPGLEKLLTPAQKSKPHAFIRFMSLEEYFDNAPRGWIRTSKVLRPEDPSLATKAASRAEELYRTQVSSDGKTVKPWFPNANRHLDRAAETRTGPCSGFVNAAYSFVFDPGFGILASPESISVSRRLKLVGSKTITDIKPEA